MCRLRRALGRCALLLTLIGVAGSVMAQETGSASGGVLRVLDKITGIVTDLEIPAGQTRDVGFLSVALVECRYPASNPSGDAYMLLQVYFRDVSTPVFQGWMVASAPALNAMDHQRYDVWALRCSTS